jgi:hypothetical protein
MFSQCHHSVPTRANSVNAFSAVDFTVPRLF